jgi:hypothetical protein
MSGRFFTNPLWRRLATIHPDYRSHGVVIATVSISRTIARLALLLATIGLYGIMAYSVARRLVVLVIVGVGAALLPASRAARLDPVAA